MNVYRVMLDIGVHDDDGGVRTEYHECRVHARTGSEALKYIVDHISLQYMDIHIIKSSWYRDLPTVVAGLILSHSVSPSELGYV